MYEYFWDDSSIYFMQTVKVDIIDSCKFSEIAPPSASFISTYDPFSKLIKVTWSAFTVTPDDGINC